MEIKDLIDIIPIKEIDEQIRIFVDKYARKPQIIIFNLYLKENLRGITELLGCQILFSVKVNSTLFELY